MDNSADLGWASSDVGGQLAIGWATSVSLMDSVLQGANPSLFTWRWQGSLRGSRSAWHSFCYLQQDRARQGIQGDPRGKVSREHRCYLLMGKPARQNANRHGHRRVENWEHFCYQSNTAHIGFFNPHRKSLMWVILLHSFDS